MGWSIHIMLIPDPTDPTRPLYGRPYRVPLSKLTTGTKIPLPQRPLKSSKPS